MTWAWLLWWRPPFLHRLVLLNLVDDKDTAIRGVIWQARGPWLTMRQAALVKANAQPLPMDGEIVIHRSNVSFVQVMP